MKGPGCMGGFVGLRLSWIMGKLPSPSSFSLLICRQFLVQYPACCCWSQYHWLFMNSRGTCSLFLGSSMTYPLSWSICNDTQQAAPSTSAGRSFTVLRCTITHSPLWGISMWRAARVVKLNLCHGSTGLWLWGQRFRGLFQNGTKVISCLLTYKH